MHDKLMWAKAAQCKLKKRVCKHKKAASEARWETDQAYVALGNSTPKWSKLISRELLPKKQEQMIR